MSKGFLTPTKDGTLLNLRGSPGAQYTSFAGTYGEDAIKLRIAAPPVEGRANAEAVRYVAELLDVTSDVSVVGGASGRNKAMFVRGVEAEEVREILSGYPS